MAVLNYRLLDYCVIDIATAVIYLANGCLGTRLLHDPPLGMSFDQIKDCFYKMVDFKLPPDWECNTPAYYDQFIRDLVSSHLANVKQQHKENKKREKGEKREKREEEETIMAMNISP